MIKLLAAVLVLSFSAVYADNGFVVTHGFSATPVFATDEPEDVKPQPVIPPPVVSEKPDYFVFFYSYDCAPCTSMKRNTLPKLKAAGYTVVEINTSEDKRWGITATPTTYIANNGFKKKTFVGNTSADTLLNAIRGVKASPTTPERIKPAIKQPVRAAYAEQPVMRQWSIHYTMNPTREESIMHLLTENMHAGRHTREELEAMSDQQLADLHDAEHNAVKYGTRRTSSVRQWKMQPPLHRMWFNNRSMRSGNCPNGQCPQ